MKYIYHFNNLPDLEMNVCNDLSHNAALENAINFGIENEAIEMTYMDVRGKERRINIVPINMAQVRRNFIARTGDCSFIRIFGRHSNKTREAKEVLHAAG